MSDYIDLTFEIDGDTWRAQVRPSLAVANLIVEIAREFEFTDSEGFELYRKGSATALTRSESLSKQHIRPGETLTFIRPALLHRLPISTTKRAVLQIRSNKEIYPIHWQPAVIGRTDADPIHMALLAINLEWIENNRRVSRRHAQITEEDGTYYIESLTPNNPTRLNRTQLDHGEKYPLKSNDRIFLVNSRVQLTFLLDK